MSGAAPVPPSLIEEYARLRPRDPPGLRADRDVRTGLPDQPRRGADAHRVDRQGVLPHRRPHRRRRRRRRRCPTSPARSSCVVATSWPGTGTDRKRPRQTISDGWLHTGDIAVRDADGFVFIRDRIKDMIISGGENIYPAEIEDVLLAHPRIADVAVIGMPVGEVGRVAAGRGRRRRRRPRRTRRLGALPGQAGPLQAARSGPCSPTSSRATPTGKALKRAAPRTIPARRP